MSRVYICRLLDTQISEISSVSCLRMLIFNNMVYLFSEEIHFIYIEIHTTIVP